MLTNVLSGNLEVLNMKQGQKKCPGVILVVLVESLPWLDA